jgi:hypothetical protein
MTYKEFVKRRSEHRRTIPGTSGAGAIHHAGAIGDEIDAFLTSQLYAESHERASFAANLGTQVHQQLLLRAITEDCMRRDGPARQPWVFAEGAYRTVGPRNRLVQHVFPGNAVPREVFESIVPVRDKRSPLDDAVSRLHNTIWMVQERARPGMALVAAEYEVICPFAIFYTSTGAGGSGAGGSGAGGSGAGAGAATGKAAEAGFNRGGAF